ncbi:MAG TPA: PhoH family protein [Candidatus Krumholzibacteria bacterium]|nr:PhoH family protein [Candidatus Krumholzibacteria bacterium]HRX51121.1 PhoH family protein [Candidatus Krumholzibacteria bacterium]
MSQADERIERRGPEELAISLEGVDQFALLGWNDSNLGLLQDRFDGTVTVRGESMVLRGPADQADRLATAVLRLIDLARRDRTLDSVTVAYVLDRADEGAVSAAPTGGDEPLFYSAADRRAIRTRTEGQAEYVDAIRGHDVVFAVGPAGTGKTYLAVVLAMDYLRRGLVERVILVRPAVEAGEQLGFLPGDLQEKIDPYLRPLYDALADTIGASRIQRFMASGVIEAAPLAYMRGRTLNQAFVILDEAQNTTLGQMKMFLTRLGHQSKAVITGDVTQIDLDGDRTSGLVAVRDILAGTDGVAFMELRRRDVVRHPLVRRIIAAFDDYDDATAAARRGPGAPQDEVAS